MEDQPALQAGWKWPREVEAGNCGVDVGGRAGRPAEDQGVACEGPGTWTVLQGLGQ